MTNTDNALKHIIRLGFMLLLSHAIPATAEQDSDPLLPVDNNLNENWLIAKLEGKDSLQMYGTAILIAVDEQKLTYVTNAHVISNNPQVWDHLIARTPINGYHPAAVRLRGVSFGYDIAVFEVANNHRKYTTNEFSSLIQSTWDSNPLEEETVQGAILAVPGWPQYSVEMRPALLNWTHTWNDRDRRPSSTGLSKPFTVVQPKVCPPSFLTHCYQIPFMTWGFSGGAFLTRRTPSTGETSPVRFSGMISHFAPGAAMTYVIPTKDLLLVAENLLKESQTSAHPFVWQTDWSNQFAFDEKMGVITGLADRVGPIVIQSSAAQRLPGGGITSGGGGRVIGNAKAVVASLGSYNDLLSLLTDPQEWLSGDAFHDLINRFSQLRGTAEVVGFVPGAAVGKNAAAANRLKGQSFINPQELIQRCLLSGCNTSELKNEVGKISVIDRTTSAQTPAAGILNEAYLRRFKSPQELGALFHNPSLSPRNDTGFTTLQELGDLMAAHSKGGIDIIVTQPGPMRAVYDARLEVHDSGVTILTLPEQPGGVQGIEVSSLIALSHQYYRFVGDLQITTNGVSKSVRGVLIVERGSDKTDSVEVRVIWVDQPNLPFEKNGLLVPEAMRLRSMHLVF